MNVDSDESGNPHSSSPRHRSLQPNHVTRIIPVALIVMFVAYSALTLAMVPLHEPWRDESQAWLISRDASLADLFGNILREEGHPALWFLLLMPFAKMGAPYVTMQIISAALMIAALAVLYVSDIPVAVKLIAPITCLFVYEIPTIARSYSVLALLCALIVKDYPHRDKHPYRYALWLALLFQTHVRAFGFAGGMLIVWLYDMARNHTLHARKNHTALLLPVLSALLSAIELFPDGSNAPQITPLANWYLSREGLICTVLFVIASSFSAAFVSLCTVAWVTVVINLVYFGVNAQKNCALLWMLAAAALTLMLHDARDRVASHNRVQRVITIGVAVALALTLVPKTRVAWQKALQDSRTTTSIGAQFAHTLHDDIESTGSDVIVPVRDATSVYAVSNSLPYLNADVRMWNPFTKTYLSYADQQYRSLIDTVDKPSLRTSDLPKNTDTNTMLFVDCTGTNGTGQPDILSHDPRYHRISRTSSQSAYNDRLSPDVTGISCSVYQHD